MFKIVINNKNIEYTSFRFQEKFNSLANELAIEVPGSLNLDYNSVVRLFYKNEPLFLGYVDEIKINKSDESLITSLGCRCITSDIIDSTMRVITRPKNYNFLSLLQELTGLSIVNISNTTNFQIPYPLKSNLGQGFGSFLQEIAKFFNVFLSCSVDGKLLIRSATKDISKLITIEDYISYNLSKNITNMFARYTCYSQTELEDSSVLVAQITDSNIRPSRFYVFESDSVLSTTLQARNLANRQKELNNANQETLNIVSLFQDKIIHVNNFCIFEKNIYFLEEIVYNISSSSKTIEYSLIGKNVYL